MLGIDALLKLADELGVISAVKDKLIMNPDPAADKLVTALEELAKIFESLNSELSRYLSITFYDGQGFKERAEERSNLVELEGGQVTARMARARGHCKKIMNIYNKYFPLIAQFVTDLADQDRTPNYQGLLGKRSKDDTKKSSAVEKEKKVTTIPHVIKTERKSKEVEKQSTFEDFS